MDNAMTQLEATLDDIVGKLKGNGFPNEQSISQGIVLRVLGDLNWDVYDPAIVWPEYSTAGGRADFALCHPPRKPRIFVEVKQPGGAEHGVKQALEYAFHTGGVPFIVLTDGRTWSFYLPMALGSYDERRVFMLDLLKRSTEESAVVLHHYLEQSRVVSGDALRVAREEYQRQSRRAAARMEIPDAWNGLVDKREKSLIDLLADSVEVKAGVRPEDADIVGFLTSLRQRSSAGLAPPRNYGTNIAEETPTGVDTPNVPTPRDDTPPGDDTTPGTTRPGRPSRWDGRIIRSTCAKNPRRPDSKGWHAHNFIMEHPGGVSYEDYKAAGHTPNHLAWDLEHGHITVEEKDAPSPLDQGTNTPMPPTTDANIHNVTSPRRGTLRMLGEEIEYKNAMDAVLIVLKRLQERDRNFLLNFYRHPDNRGTSRRFVAESVEELYEKTPDLRKYHAQIDDGWLVSTHHNNKRKKIILEIAAEVAGLTLGHDIVVDF